MRRVRSCAAPNRRPETVRTPLRRSGEGKAERPSKQQQQKAKGVGRDEPSRLLRNRNWAALLLTCEYANSTPWALFSSPKN